MPTQVEAVSPADPTPFRLFLKASEAADSLADVLSHILTGHVLGEPPASWLARDPEALRRWCKRRRRPRARRLAQLLRENDPAICRTPLLPALSSWQPDAIRNLALQAFGEPGFCARPLWQGTPAESSILSRLGDDPTLSGWIGTMGSRSAARLLARLPSRLLDGGPAVVRAWTLDAGTGVAGVETSRGLLLHFLRL